MNTPLSPSEAQPTSASEARLEKALNVAITALMRYAHGCQWQYVAKDALKEIAEIVGGEEER